MCAKLFLASLMEGVLLNSTFITLIPKKCNYEIVSDYQFISLCNNMYKLVSKSITNRLKLLINSIISSNQSTFGKQKALMTDNIMMAHELLHSLKKTKKGRVDKMTMKLDMPKVYDRGVARFGRYHEGNGF